MRPIRTHYDNLKVSRDAPEIVIRAAYRSLSQKYHPDKNVGDERAARVMAILNQSYGVLSDPDRRREHDAWIAREEQRAAQVRSEPAPSESAQYRSRPQTTPPPHDNPLHSRRPPDFSSMGAAGASRFGGLGRSARWVARRGFVVFVAIGGIALVGKSMWEQAPLPLQSPSPSPSPSELAQSTSSGVQSPQCTAFHVRYFRGSRAETSAVYRCELDGRRFYTSRPPVEAEIHDPEIENATHFDEMPSGYAAAASPDEAGSTSQAPAPVSYVRPAVAPNGHPWPRTAAYVSGYPVVHARGLSTVTVDNSENSSAVFVRLFALDGRPSPVRQFYIPAFDSFTARKITAGSYDVRYADLDSGALARSEPFAVRQTRMEGGTRYSKITMTLYKVANGNLHTYPLAAEDFEGEPPLD